MPHYTDTALYSNLCRRLASCAFHPAPFVVARDLIRCTAKQSWTFQAGAYAAKGGAQDEAGHAKGAHQHVTAHRRQALCEFAWEGSAGTQLRLQGQGRILHRASQGGACWTAG
jgi:hypothetical protein